MADLSTTICLPYKLNTNDDQSNTNTSLENFPKTPHFYKNSEKSVLRKKVLASLITSDIGGCGLNWAGPGCLDHERHYAMISDVSPSLSLSSSLSLSPRYWQYGPRKGNRLQKKALRENWCNMKKARDMNEYGEAGLRWQNNTESGLMMMKCAAGLEFWSNFWIWLRPGFGARSEGRWWNDERLSGRGGSRTKHFDL